MTEWIWLDPAVVRAIHDEQLAEHGGAPGTRDEELLDSVLARPRHLATYGDPDATALAAAYGYGIARNHPFVDGNTRTAFVAGKLFLAVNRLELAADDTGCVLSMLAVAAGELTEDSFAGWIRTRTVRR